MRKDMQSPASSRIDEILPEILHAARETFRKYRQRLYLLEMEDVCHDLVVALMDNSFARLKKFDPQKASLRTWLETVAANAAKNSIRRNRDFPGGGVNLPESYVTPVASQET
jgi:RNA polymerase sigma factor (sigma-70 family)